MKFTKRYLIHSLGLIALTAGLALGGGPAAAQSNGTVIAEGLVQPRGLAVDDAGNIYVAEAGSGGSEQQETNGPNTWNLGHSGQITRIAPDGSKTVVAKNFFSYATEQGEVAGLHGLLYANGALWGVTVGTLNLPKPVEDSGKLLRIDPSSGATTVVADFQAFERQNNPDTYSIHTNPYGLALGPDGMIYIADAGGNAITRVNPATGAVSLVAAVPGIPFPDLAQLGGNPDRGGKNELDPVPTGLAFGPDGAMYASLSSGIPFPTGAAKIIRVTTDGKVSDAALGLTFLTDLARGPDGNWYVAQLGEFDLTTDPPGFKPNSGAIWRVDGSGKHTLVAGGLSFPNKLAFDHSGNLLATTNSLIPGIGQVMRFSLTSDSVPGMPTTGQPVPFALGVALALVLLLAGSTLRRCARLSA